MTYKRAQIKNTRFEKERVRSTLKTQQAWYFDSQNFSLGYFSGDSLEVLAAFLWQLKNQREFFNTPASAAVLNFEWQSRLCPSNFSWWIVKNRILDKRIFFVNGRTGTTTP